MIDEDSTDKEFLKQFELAINKNEDYRAEERKAVIEGFSKYINDWGYLLNETDRKYILKMVQNVNINRDVSLPSWAAADYMFKNINIREGYDAVAIVTHESTHAFSDRGLMIGSINGYGLGYALNEGINTSVNIKYYAYEEGYSAQRYDTLKLSLLTDNEVLMETYQKKGPEHLIKSISKDISGVSYIDVLRYISMMDIELFIDEYQVFEDYQLPQEFYEKKDELYNKMFKAKYGYDFSESVLGSSIESLGNFNDDELYLLRYEDIYYKEYAIKKGDLSKKVSTFDFTEKLMEQYTLLNNSFGVKLLLNDPEKMIEELGTWEAVAQYIMNREATLEEVKHIRTICEDGVGENSYDLYARCIVDKALSFDLPADFITCYVRAASNQLLYDNDFYDNFTSLLVDELEKRGRNDVVDLYLNTTMDFKSINLDTLNYEVDDYYYLRKTENYIVTEDNKFVLHLNEDEKEVDTFTYKGGGISHNCWSYSSDGTYDELFDCENGRFWVFDFNEAGIEKVDRDDINVTVKLYPKVVADKSMNSSKINK